ncbi:NifU family protein [Streptomyces sp. S6]|nr:NifU family protein [Streptomyces sp. S6]
MAGADPGARIGELLDRLGREAGPQARETADELVRSVVEFYGEGLARTVRLLRSAPADSDPLAVLTADELVGDLLILHDLHPEDTMTRVGRALDKVRPYLGSHAGDVEVAGLDIEAPEGPVLRLRLRGSCDGCPPPPRPCAGRSRRPSPASPPRSPTSRWKASPRPRPAAAAPDPARPPADAPGAPPPGRRARTAPLAHPRRPALPAHDHATRVADVEGNALLLVRLPGNLYAYRDRCPGCGADLRTAPSTGSS